MNFLRSFTCKTADASIVGSIAASCIVDNIIGAGDSAVSKNGIAVIPGCTSIEELEIWADMYEVKHD